MKIIFEDKEEKEFLKLILLDYFNLKNFKAEYDPLGCQPACRDLSSPGCQYCVNNYITEGVEKGRLFLSTLCDSKDYLLNMREK